MSSDRAAKSSPQEREAVLVAMALEKTGGEREAFLRAVGADNPALLSRLKAQLAGWEQKDGLPAALPEPLRSTVKLDPPEQQGHEVVGQTIGRYKLLENLGEGGCGVVYVAEQTAPVRRRVALKVIKLGMDTKAVVARFEAERQALAMMDHPNIAKVLDAGSTDAGRPYFVMELVRGIRITEYCDQNCLPTAQRLALFIQVCYAIQHAHQKGIIHRDIKPSNILVTLNDGVPMPKVIDFGIAKATEGRLTEATVYTQLHQLIGTPAYMSPEQAEMSALDVDTRSDIYSLGVLLYELLTGRTPFDAQELESAGIDAMRRRIRETEPLRPSTRLAALTPEELTTAAKRRSAEAPRLISLLKGDLDWVVMKCLEKDRTRRYATANDLASDLQRHLQQEPVMARPPSRAYRARKWVRRNRLAFAAASAVFLALVLGLGAATAMFLRERTARQQLMAAEREQAFERAEVAATGGDFDAMQRALADAGRRGVADVQLLLLRGVYLFFTGHPRDAIEPLQQAVQRTPQSVAARALLASAYVGNDWQRSEEQLGLLRPLQPVTWEDYLFKGQAILWVDPASGLALMDKAIELKRSSPLARLVRAFARTDQATSTDDLALMQSALDDLAAARQFVPRDNLLLMTCLATAHAQAARLCGAAGRAAEQERHLQEAEVWGRPLEQFPESEVAVVQRISQLELCGREAEAFAFMQRIVPQQHHPYLLYNYGNGLYRRGRVQEAYDIYASSGESERGTGYIEKMRLIVRMELSGAGDRVKAELDQFHANYSGGLVELFAPDLYLLAGLKEEAKRRAQENCQHLPSRVPILPRYVRIAQFQAGLLDEAALIEASRGTGGDLCTVYATVGILHLAEGDRSGAKDHFQKSVQTGMYGYAYYQLARNLLARLEGDPNWPTWIPLKRTPAATNGVNTSDG